MVREIALLLGLTLVPTVVSGLWHPSRPSWQLDELREGEVILAELRRWTGPVLWLDARSAGAYESGHAPDALPLNEDDWEALIEPVLLAWQPGPPETHVVVYCDSQTCDASREVADRLRDETGWSHIYVLHGGWSVLAEERK